MNQIEIAVSSFRLCGWGLQPQAQMPHKNWAKSLASRFVPLDRDWLSVRAFLDAAEAATSPDVEPPHEPDAQECKIEEN
jgi:hypothetical protein